MSKLENMPDVRIKKYTRGYAIESKHKTWYGKIYWKPVITFAGLPDNPFYFYSIDSAQIALFSAFQSSVKVEIL